MLDFICQRMFAASMCSFYPLHMQMKSFLIHISRLRYSYRQTRMWFAIW